MSTTLFAVSSCSRGAASTLPVNIGNPQELTLLELAQTVINVTGSKSEIVFEALPVDDPQVRQPDITRARQLLGWEPQVTLDEGLRRTLGPVSAPAELPCPLRLTSPLEKT